MAASRGRKERERQMRRMEIHGAARKVFAERGYEHATFGGDRRGADFAKGSVYNYFRSKDDLFREVVFGAVEDVEGLAATALAAGGSARRSSPGTEHRWSATTGKQDFRDVMAVEMNRIHAGDRRVYLEGLLQRVNRIISILPRPSERYTPKEIIHENADDLAHLFMSTVHHRAMRLALSGRDMHTVHAQQEADFATRLFLTGQSRDRNREGNLDSHAVYDSANDAIAAPCVEAQTIDTLKLTLEQAVAIALENNHELEAARLEVGRADARVSEAVGTALPKLDFNARYAYALKKPVFYLPDFLNPESDKVTPIEIGATHAVDAGFVAEQILFDAAVYIGIGAAKTYARGAGKSFAQPRWTLSLKRARLFLRFSSPQEVYALAEENLTFSQDNYATVKTPAAQGLVAEYDLLRAEVTVENFRPEVINAENSYRQALNNLKKRLGIPYNRPVNVAGDSSIGPSLIQSLRSRSNAYLKTMRRSLPSDIRDRSTMRSPRPSDRTTSQHSPPSGTTSG